MMRDITFIIIDNASINWLVNAARLETNSLTVKFK